MSLKKIFDFKKLEPSFKSFHRAKLTTKSIDKKKESIKEHLSQVLKNIDKKTLPLIKANGVKIGFFELWNDFVKGKEVSPYDLIYVEDMLRYILEELYFNKTMNVKSKFGKLGYSRLVCSNTGKRVNLYLNSKMSDFVVTFSEYYDYKSSKREAEKVVSNKKTKGMGLNYIDVEFKTGKLMIADWFRDQKNIFNKYYQTPEDEEEDYLKYDINYSRGRINTIKLRAKKELVSIHVGNSCPSVLKTAKGLAFGSYRQDADFDFKPKGHLGNVITDLWNASIIDEAKYLSILKEAGLSKKETDALMKKAKKEALCVKVPKGKYRIYFTGMESDFDALARKRKLNIPDVMETLFLMEKI